MKYYFSFLIAFLTLLGCREENFDKNNPPVASTVSGKVVDPTTGKPISNFDLNLRRSWYQYQGHGIGRKLHDENVAAIKTDADGNYHCNFGYIPAGSGRDDYAYYLEYDKNYRLDSYDFKEIKPAENTVNDYYAWYPVKFIYSVKVSNSKNPPMNFRVTSTEYPLSHGDFGHSSIYTESGTINDFMFLRPNSNCVVHFQYYKKDASGKDVLYEKTELLRTNTEQTITKQYEIDCNTF